MIFFKASEEEILGAGSEPSEPEGVKTNSKEVKIVNRSLQILAVSGWRYRI